MVISSYANFFSLFIFTIFLAPAAILGIMGKKIKWYGIIVSIPMLVLLLGITSLQMLHFLIFIVCETFLIYFYYFFKKRFNNKFIYYLVFLLSTFPIILIKLCPHINRISYLGFIGISYISFRIWQLIIEIHDNHIEKLPLHEMLYFITFFPTISSGPIDRYQHFKNNIETKIQTNEYIHEYLLFGIKKIFLGIIYKFTLASFINIFVIAKLPSHASSIGTTILYMYAYTLYLFFDFAGYSNFAIGTSYILGVKAPENFNKPFLAHNMKEFWDRWHISLSKWFGDYLFSRFVLNTLRNGTFKSKKVAVRCGYMLTMLVMGLWHGTYVFYLVYGLYQGLMLVFTDVYVKSKTYRKFKKSKYYDVISRIVCFQIIAFGMLLFSGYLFKF